MSRSTSVNLWLNDLRFETEPYEGQVDTGRRQGRVSWSPLTVPFVEVSKSGDSKVTLGVSEGKSSRKSVIGRKTDNISEHQILRPRLATTSIPKKTTGAVPATPRRSNTLHPPVDPVQTRKITPPKSPLTRPFSHHLPRQKSHLYREPSPQKPPQSSLNLPLPIIIKEGPIDRLKFATGPGLKLPKHWTQNTYALLTENAIFFLDNSNALIAMKTGASPPCKTKINLHGARISKDLDHSHSTKKNVVLITAFDQLTTVLIQNDDARKSDAWFEEIHTRIAKNTDPGLYDATSGLGAKSALSRFFKKRPLKETLVSQGIYKSEPIFGNSLDRLHNSNEVKTEVVPYFVTRCTEILENPPHIYSVGLYRTSGNLSHIQKLRLRVDQEDAKCLDDLSLAGDSDVLAGALKLFFRELQSPLLPYSTYTQISQALSLPDSGQRLHMVQTAIMSMSPAHKRTLACLCAHLLRITKCDKLNQMSAANLAIVWGPSFTWPEEGAGSRALHLCTDVNRVVQFLIEESGMLFKDL